MLYTIAIIGLVLCVAYMVMLKLGDWFIKPEDLDDPYKSYLDDNGPWIESRSPRAE